MAEGAREAEDAPRPGDDLLWQALRTRRLELAREQGVPPYVIFHDATLAEMVRLRPSDRASLALIPGIGRSKLERYGEIFLAVIAAHATPPAADSAAPDGLAPAP